MENYLIKTERLEDLILGHKKTEKLTCTSCGFEGHSDIVGAMNLKAP